MGTSSGEQRFATRAEFARLQNVSRAAVTQWAAAERLVFAQDGRVDVEASRTRLAETASGRGGKRAPGAATVDQSPSQPAGENGTLTGARMAQVNARAKLDELEYDERVGKLVEKSRVELAIADGMGPIMSQLDTVSVRVAPKLVGLVDVRRIQDIIDDEIARIRQDTADTLRAMVAGALITRQ